MSENLVLCSVAPPISRQGRAFGLLVPATTTTNLTKFQLSRPYGLGCTFSFRAEIIIIIIKAASSIKRGSCFEGIRVCFYGLGQP